MNDLNFQNDMIYTLELEVWRCSEKTCFEYKSTLLWISGISNAACVVSDRWSDISRTINTRANGIKSNKPFKYFIFPTVRFIGDRTRQHFHSRCNQFHRKNMEKLENKKTFEWLIYFALCPIPGESVWLEWRQWVAEWRVNCQYKD